MRLNWEQDHGQLRALNTDLTRANIYFRRQNQSSCNDRQLCCSSIFNLGWFYFLQMLRILPESIHNCLQRKQLHYRLSSFSSPSPFTNSVAVSVHFYLFPGFHNPSIISADPFPRLAYVRAIHKSRVNVTSEWCMAARQMDESKCSVNRVYICHDVVWDKLYVKEILTKHLSGIFMYLQLLGIPIKRHIGDHYFF